MARWDGYSCPDDAALAAYAEGEVDQHTGRAIQDHIAACDECDSVLAATLALLKQETRRGTPWWIAFAAAVAVILISIPAWRIARRDPIVAIREAADIAPTRLIEGHLAGFEHRPYHRSRSASSPWADLKIRAQAARLTQQQNASALHARGVALLLLGDPAAASKALQLAVIREPANAPYWNDLATAHLELRRRFDLQAAIAAADEAIAISPSLPAAHFNRAVALQRLGRRADAIASYDRASIVESSSEWRDEIRARRERLAITNP